MDYGKERIPVVTNLLYKLYPSSNVAVYDVLRCYLWRFLGGH